MATTALQPYGVPGVPRTFSPKSPDIGLLTTALHIFSTAVVEPNHVSDSGNNVLIAGDLEVQATGHFGKIDMHNNEITNVDFIDFDLVNGVAAAEGRLIWNDDEGTLNLGLKGGVVNLQVGQEEVIRATNDSGGTLINGTPVYISGATGVNVTIDAADADFATGVGLRTIGLVTEDIDDGQKGYVTTAGLVRDIDTSMFFTEGVPVYLAVGGGLATAPPTQPDITYVIGVVVRKHATEGIILVLQTSLPNLNSLSDVLSSGLTDAQILAWDSGDNRWENKTPTVDIPIVLTEYDAEPARASESNIHGALLLLTAGTINVPTDTQLGPATPANDISVTKGIGKVLIVVVAGSDVAGTITVTGEGIDRDTGSSIPGHTNTITVDAVTTDNSSDDSNGNRKHAFVGAYISDDWFTGTVVLSTSDLDITVHVYHVSFEQFNDHPSLTLNTFDVNLLTTSVNAELDAYMFDLHKTTGDKADVELHGELHIGAPDGEVPIAGKYWRLRRGNINEPLDGTTDGIWVDMHFGNSPAFVEDVTMKVWATCSQPLTLT
jgi:hypothetical protein